MSTIRQEVNKLWEHNRALLPAEPRKIQVQRAGGFYKARFDGEATFTFGETPEYAIKLLRFWGDQQ
jgi:hypothetical protein